jgi:hypothetical protein
MFVQLRGGSGAGKSTLMRRMLAEHDGEVVETRVFPYTITRGPHRGTNKLERIDLWRCDGDLYVLGRYDLSSISGKGGDGVSGQKGMDMLEYYLPQVPHLAWESKWGSAETPRDARLDLLRKFGIVWATMTTPFETCLANIAARTVQRGRGRGRVADEHDEQLAYQRMHRYVDEAEAVGIRCVAIPWEDPYPDFHELLVSGGWSCGRHPHVVPQT